MATYLLIKLVFELPGRLGRFLRPGDRDGGAGLDSAPDGPRTLRSGRGEGPRTR